MSVQPISSFTDSHGVSYLRLSNGAKIKLPAAGSGTGGGGSGEQGPAGPQGPPGPTEVSLDAWNNSRISINDGLIYSPEEVYVGPTAPAPPNPVELWLDTDEVGGPPVSGGVGPTGPTGPQGPVGVGVTGPTGPAGGGATGTAGAVVAGAGLSGGGNVSPSTTVNVGQGTGITVSADAVALNTTYTNGLYAPKTHTHTPTQVGFRLGRFAAGSIPGSGYVGKTVAHGLGKTPTIAVGTCYNDGGVQSGVVSVQTMNATNVTWLIRNLNSSTAETLDVSWLVA